MTGLILLIALAAFIVLLIWLTGAITRPLAIPVGWKNLLRLSILFGAFPLTLADEVVGKYQLERLCKVNGIEGADFSRAVGRRVKAEYGENKFVPGTIMPIKEREVQFIDIESGLAVARYKSYYAMGGWLMRYTPLSMGSSRPMLFPSSCETDYVVRNTVFKQNNISLQNKI